MIVSLACIWSAMARTKQGRTACTSRVASRENYKKYIYFLKHEQECLSGFISDQSMRIATILNDPFYSNLVSLFKKEFSKFSKYIPHLTYFRYTNFSASPQTTKLLVRLGHDLRSINFQFTCGIFHYS